MVMSSTVYPFGWNLNNGISVQTINVIGSVPPSSGLPYTRGGNVFGGIPL